MVPLQVREPPEQRPDHHIQLAVRQVHADACAAPLAEGDERPLQALRLARVRPALGVEGGRAGEVVLVLVQDPGGRGDDGVGGEAVAVEGGATGGDDAGEAAGDAEGEAEAFFDDHGLGMVSCSGERGGGRRTR